MHNFKLAVKRCLLRWFLTAMALFILVLLTSMLFPSQRLYAHLATNSAGRGPAVSVLKVTDSSTKYYLVTTFADARGLQHNGILHAGRNYVYCKMNFSDPLTKITDAAGNYNEWWLWTDMDTGGQDYISAYYLSKWGNNEAKDDSGQDIPLCNNPNTHIHNV